MPKKTRSSRRKEAPSKKLKPKRIKSAEVRELLLCNKRHWRIAEEARKRLGKLGWEVDGTFIADHPPLDEFDDERGAIAWAIDKLRNRLARLYGKRASLEIGPETVNLFVGKLRHFDTDSTDHAVNQLFPFPRPL